MKRHTRKERGSALLVALMVSFVLAVLGGVLILTSSTELKISHNEQLANDALLTADAGVQYMIHALKTSQPSAVNIDALPVTLTGTLSPIGASVTKSFSVTLSKKQVSLGTSAKKPSIFYIESTGTISTVNQTLATRIVGTEFMLPPGAFDFAYFSQCYTHLDRHEAANALNVGSSAFSNGEFELSPDMVMDGGPIIAMGHVSVGGVLNGDVYAPSVDVQGPDNKGQNTQTFTQTSPNQHLINGNIYLMNGYDIIRDVNGKPIPDANGNYQFEVHTVSSCKNPSYGCYHSMSAATVGTDPDTPCRGGAVAVPCGHKNTGSTNVMSYTTFTDGTGTYNTTDRISGSKIQIDYTTPGTQVGDLDPVLEGGKVMIGKPMPTFNKKEADKWAEKGVASNYQIPYHILIGRNTYFTDPTSFVNWAKTQTFNSGPGGIPIYEIGDPDQGTIFIIESGSLTMSAFGSSIVIVHGGIVMYNGGYSRSQKSGNAPAACFFSCGSRPTPDQPGAWGGWQDKDGNALPARSHWLGWSNINFTTNPDGTPAQDYMSEIYYNVGFDEQIPFALPSVVSLGSGKTDDKDNVTHATYRGIIFSEAEIHFHNKLPEGRIFIHGAEVCDTIHNCLYMSFYYDACSREAGANWFTSPDILDMKITSWTEVLQ